MVAVAPDHVLKLRKAFRVGGQHARLVEHQHPEFVAGIEQFRGRRVVRGAHGVAAHFLELAHAEILHRIRQRHTETCVILMVARALYLHRFAVEEESAIGVELQIANPEARLIAVRDGPAGLDLGHQLVQVPLFQRPQRRLVDDDLLLKGALAEQPEPGTGVLAVLPTSLPEGSRMVEMTRTFGGALAIGSRSRSEWRWWPGPAASWRSPSVPHFFTWTGAVLTSQTCR